MRDEQRSASRTARRRTRRACLSNSIAPTKLTCSTSTATSSAGSATRSTPTIAMLPGISMMTPSDRLTSVGVPQPSLAIGPIRNVPCCGGKNARRSLMIRGALATTSLREHHAVDRAGADALARAPRASSSRLRPSRPPTPSSVKPKPSWMPGAELGGDDDQQREAVRAVRHLGRDEADRLERREARRTSSSSAPAYSPRSVSMKRKPPPLTTPASTARPTPLGGLNPKPRSTGPRLPPPGGKRRADDQARCGRPTPGAGPSIAEKPAESSIGQRAVGRQAGAR